MNKHNFLSGAKIWTGYNNLYLPRTFNAKTYIILRIVGIDTFNHARTVQLTVTTKEVWNLGVVEPLLPESNLVINSGTEVSFRRLTGSLVAAQKNFGRSQRLTSWERCKKFWNNIEFKIEQSISLYRVKVLYRVLVLYWVQVLYRVQVLYWVKVSITSIVSSTSIDYKYFLVPSTIIVSGKMTVRLGQIHITTRLTTNSLINDVNIVVLITWVGI